MSSDVSRNAQEIDASRERIQSIVRLVKNYDVERGFTARRRHYSWREGVEPVDLLHAAFSVAICRLVHDLSSWIHQRAHRYNFGPHSVNLSINCPLRLSASKSKYKI